MTIRRPPSGRAGFTLLELIVALAIGGLVLLAAYGAVDIAATATARLRDAARAELRAGAIRSTLEAWLRAATVTGDLSPFIGVGRRAGADLPLDELEFAVHDAGPLRPGPHRLHLWIDRDESTPRRGLVVELVPLHRGTWSAETLEVAPGAEGLSLRYRVRIAAREQWVDAWQSNQQLPSALRLQIFGAPASTAGESRREVLPPLLALPITIGIAEGFDAAAR